MESKKGFGKLMEQIIEGRGFYIVMALCAAVIGVSVWSLVREPADYLDEAAQYLGRKAFFSIK